MTTSTAVLHGTTITEYRLGIRTVLRAQCLCGWSSDLLNSRQAATKAGHAHTAGPRITGPIECAPWCDYGDGHTNVSFAVDQVCCGREARVNMSLQEPLRENIQAGGDASSVGWIDEPDYLTIYPSRTADGSEQVRVTHAEGGEVLLTLDEARKLAEALQGTLATIAAGEQA